MTQEELDALMDGATDDIDALDDMDIDALSDSMSDDITSDTVTTDEEDLEDVLEEVGEMDTRDQLPLPATDENKMVHQLDDVTKESEEKASEIFDIIENISNDLMDKERNINSIIDVLNSNVELFTTLTEKFPEVEAFKVQLEKNEKSLIESNDTLETLQSSGDAIMSVMDIMQYQDIHRQKIERVINVMRALSKYMNNLFESKVADEDRVSSAQHISGDKHNDVASTDDIEALLEQFGN